MKRPGANAMFFLLPAIAAALAYFSVSWSRWLGNGPLVASGTIEAHEVLAGSRVGGRVAKVLVQEGDRVEPGQVILELERTELEAARAQAAAAAAQAKAYLDQLLAGSRPEEVARARAAARAAQESLKSLRTWPRKEELEAAKADLEAARSELVLSELQHRRAEELFEKSASSEAERDAAKSLLDSNRAKVASLRERLRIFETGSRPEDIRAAEERFQEALATQELVEKGPRREEIDRAKAALEEAGARLRVLEAQLDEMTVRSLSEAVVEVFETRPGDLAGPHAPLATLLEPDLWVRVFVPESKIGLIQVGGEVSVRTDSFPDRSFRGIVERIQRKAEFTPRNVQTPEERVNQVFGVKVRLPDPEKLLRAGMAADVTFPPLPGSAAAGGSR